MPYLKKAPKRTKIKKKKIDENDKIYHSKKWKLLRAWYFAHHPLCEICLAAGRAITAVDCHHKDSFSNY